MAKGFAIADDFEDASGEQVLNFWAAQVRARELVRGKASDASKPVTVAEALEEYERDLAIRGGLVAHVQRVRRLLTPALLERPVGLLVMRELRRWRDGELARGLAPATVTRTCKAFAAALNYATNHDPSIVNRANWKVGLAALPDSHVARVDAILGDDQVCVIVAACHAADPRLGLLVELLAVTGCRPVQAARLTVGDLQADRLMMPRAPKAAGRSGSSVGRSRSRRRWWRSCGRLLPIGRTARRCSSDPTGKRGVRTFRPQPPVRPRPGRRRLAEGGALHLAA